MNTIITNITIGNWYLVRGKPTKITPANVVWAFRDGCFPMPLTDEILKKNGFNREGGASYWYDDMFQMVLFHWNEERLELVITSDNERHHQLKLDIKYVHQLQDAMRLCNIKNSITVL